MQYLYPKNLKRKAKVWFWSLGDAVRVGAAVLVAVLLSLLLKSVTPLAATLCYAIFAARFDEVSVLDYLRWAIRYLLTEQQIYYWR